MSAGWIGIDIIISLALSLITALNLALRIGTRSRLAPHFENRPGRSFERFITLRAQYLQATAIVRAAFILLLVLVLFHHGRIGEVSLGDQRTLVFSAIAFGFLLVFGVAVPNAWAKYCGDGLIIRLLPMIAVLRIVCLPISWLLDVFDPIVRRLAGVPLRGISSYADQLEEEILHVVTEGELHGAVDEEEKEMIESVIELTDTRVDKIMTPRTQIAAIPAGSTYDQVLDTIRNEGHSRIPIYEQTIDTVLGVLYVKDLLQRPSDEPFALSRLLRKPLFIPESKLVRDLLREFQERKIHIAIVLDEYGGTAGLVTIEDILEELVGEITDEYDSSTPQHLKRIDESTVEVDARMTIQDLNEQLGLQLPEDRDYETIGGFVFSTMGKIPSVGEHCAHDHVGIQVIAAEPRRVTRLRLNIQPQPADGTSA